MRDPLGTRACAPQLTWSWKHYDRGNVRDKAEEHTSPGTSMHENITEIHQRNPAASPNHTIIL